ncbi:MAG: division/cell wall cluster transcriptional repressor MraZ [Candidatus Competibacteraceae bacterium]|nr:division/cell wall cluster transcriptional repressor MraZ [Candidatus Competibacteraceae bacterium]
MQAFLGEFDCRLDAKSRISLPAALKRQIPPAAQNRFVINRGFERHLVLYPMNAWEIISAEVNRLNLYVKKNRDFVRYFFRGATELKLDAQSRLLLPKRLLDYATIQDEIVLFAYGNRIEVWARELYDHTLSDEPEDFAELAEEIMGRVDDSPPRP